ncbi:hypothetical protein BJ085DRAFT_27286 [Dimargaris cristalligena]|uniref:Uncharacterized protein n=1 Tax=Dimargaris cristalligena TaxID=215637 RepID=A0A4P9ZM85_9FUNG|nr:hypothetical protein BJ085DRAFT_27286 [Dimargaris cristalligena]|eukprot:RKP34238.1 hypothetical protein BJ085DRAFT_27286 [Dimargaris cristalligena]
MYLFHGWPTNILASKQIYCLRVASTDPEATLVPRFVTSIQQHPTLTKILDHPDTYLPADPSTLGRLVYLCNEEQTCGLYQFMEIHQVRIPAHYLNHRILQLAEAHDWAQMDELLQAWTAAQREPLDPLGFTLLLRYDLERGKLDRIIPLLQDYMQSNMRANIQLISMLVHGFAVYDRVDLIQELLGLITEHYPWRKALARSVVGRTNILHALTRLRAWPDFNRLVTKWRSLQGDAGFYTVVLRGLLLQGKQSEVAEYLERIKGKGTSVNSYLLPVVMQINMLNSDSPVAQQLVENAEAHPEKFQFDVNLVMRLLDVYNQVLSPQTFHSVMDRLYHHHHEQLPLSVLLMYVRSCFQVKNLDAVVRALKRIEERHPEPHPAIYLVLLVGYGMLRKVSVWTALVRRLQFDRIPIPITIYGAIMNAFNFVGDGVTVIRYYDYLIHKLYENRVDQATNDGDSGPPIPIYQPHLVNSNNSVHTLTAGGLADGSLIDSYSGMPTDPCRPELFNLVLPNTSQPTHAILTITFNSLGINNFYHTDTILKLWQQVRDRHLPMAQLSYMALIRALGCHHVLPLYIETLLEEIQARHIHLDHTSQRKIKRILDNHERFYPSELAVVTPISNDRINELIDRIPPPLNQTSDEVDTNPTWTNPLAVELGDDEGRLLSDNQFIDFDQTEDDDPNATPKRPV